MLKIKIIFIAMLFISLCVPAYQTIAQDTTNNENETVQVDETPSVAKVKKSDKKKDKDKEKDVIEINERFLLCLLINIITQALIILLVYYPQNRQVETVFTFIMFNLMIFMLTFVLNKVKISMGAAFGLFAVFSMLRYRTEGISMKDMTYLFIFIGVGLISAIQLEYYELAIINGTIVIFTIVLDRNVIFKREHSKLVEYENIELIKPENQEQLIADLKLRTGLKIHRVNIEEINFLKDTADIKIYYYE